MRVKQLHIKSSHQIAAYLVRPGLDITGRGKRASRVAAQFPRKNSREMQNTVMRRGSVRHGSCSNSHCYSSRPCFVMRCQTKHVRSSGRVQSSSGSVVSAELPETHLLLVLPCLLTSSLACDQSSAILVCTATQQCVQRWCQCVGLSTISLA